VVVGVIFAAGLYATCVRFFRGLEASTNLSDPVPWGLWVGLNTLCGVGLSAGGFAIAAAVYILGLRRYRPVLRAAILVSFLGYLSVVAGMLFELGLPWRIWHPIVLWNRRSVLFEVAWCVMLYTTVLALEFSPAVFERLRWHRLRDWHERWHRRLLIPLVLVGVLLSSLHQSFLGGLYLITKGKLYPLWYSPQLPALFFLSSIPAGLAVVVMALYLSARSLGVRLDFSILHDLRRVIPLLLIFYGLFRGLDLFSRGGWEYLWKPRAETGWFWLEISLFVLLPLVLLRLERVRTNPLGLYGTSVVVVMGFMANRMNVAINALEASSSYFPRWTEMAISLAVITAAVVAFRTAALHLEIFPKVAATARPVLEWRWMPTIRPPQPQAQ
jgi:Ni/Fe-hydrogenase subunit HybB-like protein